MVVFFRESIIDSFVICHLYAPIFQQQKPSKSITSTTNSKKVQPTLKSSYSGSHTRLSKYKSKEEKSKSSQQQIKLPKINTSKKTGKTQGYASTSKTNQETQIGRRKKFANVKSSGYGRTTYKPSRKAENPSATSTLTEKTAKTAGTSSQISSKTIHNDHVASSSKHTKTVRSKKLQPIRREPTLSNLPSIR